MGRQSLARERFRAILEGGECVYPASVFDPITCRMADSLGFKAAVLGGSVASLVELGAPDLIMMTLTELADTTRRICRGSSLPLLVDADHGFGNALNVMRTIEELEATGVAAITIEDTDLPRPFGRNGKPTMISLDEGIGKLKAALAARSDPALAIVARTGAAGITGIDEAVMRAKAYEQAGAEAIFLTGIRSRPAVDRIGAEVRIPVMLGKVTDEMDDKVYLASNGVRIGLQGHEAYSAAIEAVRQTYLALQGGTKPSVLQGIASEALINELIRDEKYNSDTRLFLGRKD